MKTIEALNKKDIENSLVKLISACTNTADCVLLKELVNNTIWMKEVLTDIEVQAYRVVVENTHNALLEKQSKILSNEQL